MALINCPACAAQISEQADVCPNCGKAVDSSASRRGGAPIRRLGGKFQAAGTVLLAAGVIATVLGAWWGAALLFPGIVIFVLGRLL